MKKLYSFLMREKMLALSLLAAAASLIITPLTPKRLLEIDWRTLGTLLMMLCVLEGFKRENVLRPIAAFAARLGKMTALSLFLVFGVFFTSMFVTNDVSLIIFVPLTIQLFRQGGKEKYILPIISMENIAAIRGSMLMPFGSPQNLFLFGQSGISFSRFVLHMLPLWVSSAALLSVFILLIVTRTKLWPIALAIVLATIAFTDRTLLKKVDYVLLMTFLCFFIFSSSIAANPNIAGMLKKAVANHEYAWSIGLSQIISNVPATIVLYPFTENVSALIYGADTAGLCSIIGSLASVINYRIYVREYPENGGKFLRVFTLISWAFFALVALPGFFLCRWRFF